MQRRKDRIVKQIFYQIFSDIVTKMEELQTYFEDYLQLIKQNRELVNGDQEETRTILLELNTVCLSMKAQLAQHKKEVQDWKHQIDCAKR